MASNYSQIMPSAFIGHGSPMNALANNDYTKSLNILSAKLVKPDAILCISAHWMTRGVFATGQPKPKTIHDFYGFPEELYQIQYPADGNTELANLVVQTLKESSKDSSFQNLKDISVELDASKWGFDHGSWSVMKHIYPSANIPMIQLSLDIQKPPVFHFEIGKALRHLREKNILIIGSGNLVHNLRQIDWNEKGPVFPWAKEFDNWCKEKIMENDTDSLVNKFTLHPYGKQSIPTLDHYLPFITILGTKFENEKPHFFFEEIQNGSIAMRSFYYEQPNIL